jgi:Protein of unknown function (DUF2817)
MSRSNINPITRQGVSSRIAALFPRSYEGSRARFRRNLDRVQQFWSNARLVAHRISNQEELTIDWIQADPLATCERVLVLTTGEHGIEAYVGSAVLQVLIDEYLHRLAPRSTGLLLVHAINPWGMKYRRRVNSQNVDLNRNFLWTSRDDDSAFDPAFNPAYRQLSALLNPQKPVRHWLTSMFLFSFRLGRDLIRFGHNGFKTTAGIGQYFEPHGIYYGGSKLQEEAHLLADLLRRQIEPYHQVLMIDVHTGYGPRYQMSLVNSSLDPRDSASLAQEFYYPSILKSNTDSFYDIRGDLIDYVYNLVNAEFPDAGLYATTFEFGTFGSSAFAWMRDLRAMILENQLYWYGTHSNSARDWILREFEELYLPNELKWRTKAIEDARRAFEGILRAEGFLEA